MNTLGSETASLNCDWRLMQSQQHMRPVDEGSENDWLWSFAFYCHDFIFFAALGGATDWNCIGVWKR
jgi:hypothetical protein